MNFKKHNKGSALAVCLTILTAVTLVSVTAMQRSGLQGRMVGNIQHNEIAFNVSNSELEEIYDFYGSQASATEALSKPLNEFDIKEVKDTSGNVIGQEQSFKPVEPGHSSSYSNYSPSNHGSTSRNTPARLKIESNIQHTGVRSSLVEGFSVGTFVEYGFIATAISSEPDIASGQQLSSQTIGIKYIAPAG